jgi:hypothetical protein
MGCAPVVAEARPYRATTAHALAYERASRPKPAKLATNLALRAIVQDDLQRRYSPEQIAGRLRRRFPGNPEMWVSTETIYQSLYVQSRGALRRELTRYLRTGRALRKPGRQVGQRKNRIPDMVNTAQRPPEADDRAVPGHWEGDLADRQAQRRPSGRGVGRRRGARPIRSRCGRRRGGRPGRRGSPGRCSQRVLPVPGGPSRTTLALNRVGGKCCGSGR